MVKPRIKMNRAGMRRLEALAQGVTGRMEQAIQSVGAEMAGQPADVVHRELMRRVKAAGAEPNSKEMRDLARKISQAGK